MRPWIRWIVGIIIATVVVVVTVWAIFRLWSELAPKWGLQTTIAVAIIAAVLLSGIWWLCWRLPRRQVDPLAICDPKARADTDDNFGKMVSRALGGTAVLIGAGAAYLQFTEQQRASHDLLISNEVSKGFEQLASDEITMRLGGIYALEGVMNTSPEYHQPALKALCAFVSNIKPGKVNDKPAADVQAALTVIGRRKPGGGDVSLAGANISAARLPNADLVAARLSGANLSRADLTGANLDGANLTDAVLYKADLNKANLSNADLSRAYLGDANLTIAKLSGTNLVDARLPGANLSGAYPSHANLSGADLTGANLGGADLSHANLNGGHLSHVSLINAHLGNADLSNADLSNATLIGVHLRGANLIGTDLSFTDLTDATLDGQEQLDKACGTDAKLPPGLTLKPCPAK